MVVIVSRKSSKPKILAAAREMLLETDGAPMTVTQVAERAGLSRQGVYLHFDDSTQLLLELSRVVDAETRTPELQATIDAAPTGRGALHNAVAVQAHIKPRLNALISAIEPLRHSDQGARSMYEEREAARYDRVVTVVERLAAEGQLAPEWDIPTAARLAWVVMSQRSWQDLAWSEQQYTDQVFHFLERALCR